MSWDARLIDDRGHVEGDWNYTHNTNAMIAAALTTATGTPVEQCEGLLGAAIGPAWWRLLDGLSGPDGAKMLGTVVAALRADPVRYREMNPSNGWGDYDSLVGVLDEMHRAVPEWPEGPDPKRPDASHCTNWEVSG